MGVNTPSDDIETDELDPRLAQYKADYEKWSDELKQKIAWEKIQKKLLANNSLQLPRALALNGGGVMFGIDENKKILFADAGVESVMTGMNYADSRDKVRFTTNKKGKKTETGYEMFPEDLIEVFEQFTGHPVVASTNRKKWKSIWLENKDNPCGWACRADFVPAVGRAYMSVCHPGDATSDRRRPSSAKSLKIVVFVQPFQRVSQTVIIYSPRIFASQFYARFQCAKQ